MTAGGQAEVTMYVIIWTYRVEAQDQNGFERAYRPGGDWTRLFAQSQGYRGTELLRGADDLYVTVDRWDCEASWQGFLRDHGEAYGDLDRDTEALIQTETRIGAFTTVD